MADSSNVSRVASPGKPSTSVSRSDSPKTRVSTSVGRSDSKKSIGNTAGAKKDTSKSTAEGEWEMRDGKWYRRDYYAIKAGEQQKQTVKVKCPNCPTYQERITIVTKERDDYLQGLKRKEADLVALQAKYTSLETQQVTSEKTIRELEERLRNSGDSVHMTIREKEVIIINLTQQISDYESKLAAKNAEFENLQKEMADLLNVCGDLDQRLQSFQRQAEELTRIKAELELQLSKLTSDLNTQNDRFQSQSKLIMELEEQISFCKVNHGKQVLPLPVPRAAENIRWYYAVQNPLHAQLFQKERVYEGGEIVIDPMEGATVVNPDYYSQSEQVPGDSRLRVRVVYAQVPGASIAGVSSTEIFIRLRLGSATQFTPPRPHLQTVTWNQDFVFVGVPVVEKESGYFLPAESLTVEVVSRGIGSAAEIILGTAIVDMANLVHAVTRQVIVSLNKGGVVHLRIKALDFGLPAPATSTYEQSYMVSEPVTVSQNTTSNGEEVVHQRNVFTTYTITSSENSSFQ